MKYSFLTDKLKFVILVSILIKICYSNPLEIVEKMQIDSRKEEVTPETDKAIHFANRKKHKESLSHIERELEIIEACCSDQMNRLGYRMEGADFDTRYFKKRFLYS
jgi:hypothetical protein